MKKLLTICLLAITCMVFSAEAAQPNSKDAKTQKREAQKTEIVTTQFKTNIDCNECEKKIMNKIPYVKGVQNVKVDLKSKIVTVSYDKSKNSDSSLIRSFQKIKVEAKVLSRK